MDIYDFANNPKIARKIDRIVLTYETYHDNIISTAEEERQENLSYGISMRDIERMYIETIIKSYDNLGYELTNEIANMLIKELKINHRDEEIDENIYKIYKFSEKYSKEVINDWKENIL